MRERSIERTMGDLGIQSHLSHSHTHSRSLSPTHILSLSCSLTLSCSLSLPCAFLQTPLADISTQSPGKGKRETRKRETPSTSNDARKICQKSIVTKCTVKNELKQTLENFLPGKGKKACAPREVGGWGRDPFSRNFMKPTPRRKWYLTTGRRFH